jgi:hypothetical protein
MNTNTKRCKTFRAKSFNSMRFGHSATASRRTRRFTRLTNAFSKKLENHAYSVALHFMYYNFCRIHSSLRVTPAMAAGVADHVWTMEEVAALL